MQPKLPFTLRLRRDLHDRLDLEAANARTTKTAIVENALDDRLPDLPADDTELKVVPGG